MMIFDFNKTSTIPVDGIFVRGLSGLVGYKITKADNPIINNPYRVFKNDSKTLELTTRELAESLYLFDEFKNHFNDMNDENKYKHIITFIAKSLQKYSGKMLYLKSIQFHLVQHLNSYDDEIEKIDIFNPKFKVILCGYFVD